MTEQNFKRIVDGLWSAYRKSASMLRMLEGIGLLIDGEKGKSGLHELYGIQDSVVETIVDMFGPVEARTALSINIHEFLCSIDDIKLSDNRHQELLYILEQYGVKLPWKTKLAPGFHDKCRLHRGLSIKDKEPVTGYVWNGADHIYITPYNTGISFDGERNRLTAYAVEVYPETVAINMLMKDDAGLDLFEGDMVKIGDEIFTLSLTDINVLQKLAGSERKEKGLFRVEANYESIVTR